MPAPKDWEAVCNLSDIPANSGVCALVDNKQVAIFRIGETEELYALDNCDPFSNANVLSRGLIGDIKGEVVVASPIYKQHFSLKTGQCLEDDTVCLDTFSVTVDSDKVLVSV